MSTARKIYRSQNSGDNELNNKVSNHIQTQLPEFIQADHPVFSQFVRLYYQFLESAELVFLETNNYLNEETQAINFILDEDGEKIVLEDSEIKLSYDFFYIRHFSIFLDFLILFKTIKLVFNMKGSIPGEEF